MSELPPVSIRPLHHPNEVPLCARLLVSSEPWFNQHRTYEEGMRLLRDPAKEVYVAEVNTAVVGLIVLHTGAPFSGYLQAISVRPEWRNRGIGRNLIIFAEQRLFRESPSICLCVSSANTAAQRLYVRLGYQPVGAMSEPLPGNPSEILMCKTCDTGHTFCTIHPNKKGEAETSPSKNLTPLRPWPEPPPRHRGFPSP